MFSKGKAQLSIIYIKIIILNIYVFGGLSSKERRNC